MRQVTCVALASLLLVGCVTANEMAMQIGKPPANAEQIREVETRRWSGDEVLLLTEATQVLQDLGYSVVESSGPGGLLAANKHRDARESGQIVGAVVMGVLFGANAMQWDTEQLIRVTLTTWPTPQNGLVLAAATSRPVTMRVSLERLILNNKGQVRYQPLTDPALLQEFYTKLEQSLGGRVQRL